MTQYPGRLIPTNPRTTTVLLVDVQNSEISERTRGEYPEYVRAVETRVVPTLQRLLPLARAAGCEIMYTTIESLTRDGRDRSLDHKISGFLVPRGAWEGQVIDALAPGEDDIWLKKTSSGVFNSTNIDYVLRNLGTEFLVVVGLVTDQCVDMAVRDAADRGYRVICLTDACAAYSEERHDAALTAFGGYCRLMTTDEFLAELQVPDRSPTL